MSFKSEHLQPVTSLSNDLYNELEQSHHKVDKITELLKKIGYLVGIEIENNSEGKNDSRVITDNEKKESEDVIEESSIEKIKNENLQMLMDIQREEYIGHKWERVLSDNQQIFNSLTDWIKFDFNRSSIDSLELEAAKHLQLLKGSKQQLTKDIKESEQRIKAMVKILEDLESILDEEIAEQSLRK